MSVEQRERIVIGKESVAEESEAMRKLRQALAEAAGQIVSEEGINLGRMGLLERERQIARELYLTTARRYDLLRIDRRMGTDKREIRVTPKTIELTVIDDDWQKTLFVAPERKVMLALFADFTLQKVGRCLQPWIHLDDFVDFSQGRYSRNQAHDKLFEFFIEIGILTSHQTSGYHLNCDPEKLLAILQGNMREYSLEVDRKGEWCDFDKLLDDFLLPAVKVIWEQRPRIEEGVGADERLDTERVARLTGKYQDTVYSYLRRLEEIGLILRQNNLYHLKDVAWKTIEEIIEVNREPYLPRVVREKFVSGDNLAARQPERKKPLYVHRQEYPNYPEISWGKYGLKVGFDKVVPKREDKLKLIKQILLAGLENKTVLDDKRRLIIFDNKMPAVFRLPSNDGFTVEQVIVVLNFLGFGPKETVKYIRSSDRTLEETIIRLESEEPMFIDAVKSRLASLLLDNIVTPLEARDFPYADLKQWLAEI